MTSSAITKKTQATIRIACAWIFLRIVFFKNKSQLALYRRETSFKVGDDVVDMLCSD